MAINEVTGRKRLLELMIMKLWGGRFTKETDDLVHAFNASLAFDQRLYHYDIMGSIVHVEMLVKQGILEAEEGDIIKKGLETIEKEIEQGILSFDSTYEDIHSFVEGNLIAKIGPVGGKLHTGRSRNDQVALDIRLYLRDEIRNIQELLLYFMQDLLGLAEKYKDVYLPGYTHLQRAQVITLAHHLLAYYFKLKRDYERLTDNLKRVNVLPLGAGALAGTSYPLDREYVAERLAFDAVSENSLDAVSDRDFILEFHSIAATIIMHLSSFSEELILWSSNEFDFIELDDAYSTGSSIMPQKKNPDIAELVRGKTGRIYGNMLQLFTTLKGLPLAYNKDMQEDKEGLFDTIDTLKAILQIYPEMLKTMKVKKEKMYQACQKGFLNATDLADYLSKKGLPFRKAHEIVGQAVLYCLENQLELEELDYKQYQELFPGQKELFTADLNKYLAIKYTVENRKLTGGTAPEETERIIGKENKWLEDTLA
ncbi:MAG: argininosuccinate lyase [Halanaerobiales bacterium]|jgi:argininosuccinate lyase